MKHLLAALLRYRYFHYIDAAQKEGSPRHVEAELDLIERFLSPDKAFFDVGANVGMYVYAARKHIPDSRIFAFEPQGEYVSRIKKLFPKVHVEQVALSSSAGSAQFKVPLIGGHMYSARGTLEKFLEAGESDARTEMVRTTTLDLAKRELNSGPVGCIKIDVEGHEKQVLLGAQDTIARDKPVLMVEIEQRHHQEPIEDIFSWIRARGYDGSFWDYRAKALRPISKFSVEANQRLEDAKTPAYVNNFIFTPHA